MTCEAGTNIVLKHGEIKTLTFTYTIDGTPLNITGAILNLQLKENLEDTTPALEIMDGAFTKTLNVAEAAIDTSSLTPGVKYLAEIKAVFVIGTDEDKSDTFFVEVQEAVIT